MSVQAFIISASILLIALNCFGQQKTDGQELQKKYKVTNRAITPGTTTGSVHLNEAEGLGIAWISGQEFGYGVIEFDVKGKDALQRSFVGFAFHGLNDTTYEAIYFRPFNFQATDPARKAQGVQARAVSHSESDRCRRHGCRVPRRTRSPASSRRAQGAAR